jgi:16S rRNA pseudouridine516 synthase
VDKGYLAMVSGVLPSDAAELFERGVDIGDEEPTAPAILKAVLENDPLDTYFDGREIPGTVKVHIVITEGRYHQIKRMFEALGCRVEYLKRISMGSLVLDKDLGVGNYRELNPGELEGLGIKCYYSQ